MVIRSKLEPEPDEEREDEAAARSRLAMNSLCRAARAPWVEEREMAGMAVVEGVEGGE